MASKRKRNTGHGTGLTVVFRDEKLKRKALKLAVKKGHIYRTSGKPNVPALVKELLEVA